MPNELIINNALEIIINNALEIIESKDDKSILSDIGNFQKDFMQPISDIQVNKLVLNDIEFPTDYSKMKQIKAELIVRYNSILESYYNIKKKELEIELLDEEAINEPHPIKKKIKLLDNEKANLQLIAERSKLNVILTEIRTYYKYYKIHTGKFKDLTEKQKEDLEVEFWQKKALNNPVVFEERYGEFLKDILGESKYNIYLNKRRTIMGSFARELVHDI